MEGTKGTTIQQKSQKPRTKKVIPPPKNAKVTVKKTRTKKIIPALDDYETVAVRTTQFVAAKKSNKHILNDYESVSNPELTASIDKTIIQNNIKERNIKPAISFPKKEEEAKDPEYNALETACKDSHNQYSKSCNDLLTQKEIIEREESISQSQPTNDFLYPTLNDMNFNVKIAEKKEFQETKYDGTLHDINENKQKNEENFDEYANQIINADFELAPHQHFVRNYLSFQTPYNSLLLFHGLGSGKTLTAIGIAEEMREYLKRIGIKKKIIIVASSNVVDNFKLQLFDEGKMSKTQPWTMGNIIGNKLINEVNPTNIRVSRDTIVKEVNRLVKKNYKFYGYIKFAHRINEVIGDDGMTDISVYNLRREFNNSLIIIDEIQNMKNVKDSKNGKDKIASKAFQLLVKNANNLRLLFLTATPMFNSCKELIWILNMMNMNDRR